MFPHSLFARAQSPWDSQAPIREELFSVERLEEHARSLATAQAVTPMPNKGRSLAGRLAENEAALLDAYRTMTAVIDEGRVITPAADRLIDNYHLIERQIREIRADLPPGYYRQLPKLAIGPFAGYPRVFGMVWAFVAHTDSCFDSEILRRYVRAYQEVQPLTIGELWAVSITLRFVMSKTCGGSPSRSCEVASAGRRRIVSPTDCWESADRRAIRDDRACRAMQCATFSGRVRRAARAQAARPGSRDFAGARLAGRTTRGQRTTADEVVQDVHRRMGASNVSVRNIITSMRLIADLDWNDLFERISLVDDVLRADGAFQGHGFFDAQPLSRRDRRIGARVGPHGARYCARRNPRRRGRVGDMRGIDARRALRDPGYHLFAGGRLEFEKTIGFRPPLRKWLARLNQTFGIGGYVGGHCNRLRDPARGAPADPRRGGARWTIRSFCSACWAPSQPSMWRSRSSIAA